MGAPGCFVIIDAEGSRYYPCRWAGNGVCATLLAGPKAATETIESCHQRNDDAGAAWLTERGLDGGAVIDHPHRALTWFGDYYLLWEQPIRDTVTALLELLWPGWRLEWAERGAADLAAAAGLARAPEDPPRSPDPGPPAEPRSRHSRLSALDETVALLAAVFNQTTTITAFDQRPLPEFRRSRDRASFDDATWSTVLLAAEELRSGWASGA
ncbi:hypothetical protein [Nocardia sp. NPDC004722]